MEWSAQNAHEQFDKLMSDSERAHKWLDLDFALSEHPDMQGLGGHTSIVFQKPSN